MPGRHRTQRRSNRTPAERRTAARRVPLLLLLPLLVVLLAGGGVLANAIHREHGSRSATDSGHVPGAARRCAGQLAVPVVVSPELTGAVTRLAADWHAGHPSVGGRCLSATVTPQDSASAAVYLAGTRTPTVWIPDSSIWSSRLAATHRAIVRSTGPVASSPLVVAAAPGAVTQVRREAAAGWPGVLGGSLLPRITDPSTTAAGALTVLGAAAAASTSSAAQSTVVGLFLRLQAATFPSAAAGFAALRTDPRHPPAFITSEQAVYAANAEHVSAPVTAVYPTGPTPVLDYPVVEVASAHPSSSAAAAAAAFTRMLRTRAAAATFASIGLRDPAADPLAESVDGVSATQVRPAGTPPVTVQATAARLWRAASKPSRLLAVFDVSGSMNDPARPGGHRKIVIAAHAARQALGVLPDDWTLGLWTFATPTESTAGWTELAPLEALRRDRQRLLAAAASLPDRVGGNTPLYRTALAAFTDVSRHYDPAAVNVVVLLTDGSNVDPNGHLSLKQLVGTLRHRYNPREPVRIVTLAFGRDADTSALRQISAATHGQSYRVDDAAAIRQVIVDSIIANNR